VTSARYRLSSLAKADIAFLLRDSQARYGVEARLRYRGLLAAAMRRVAADPTGRSTVDRSELLPALRSFHIRHCRAESREAPVGEPVHVIFYRAGERGLVEIVRVLHERMDPGRHVGEEAQDR
jgi:toxin ParE1/3/4